MRSFYRVLLGCVVCFSRWLGKPLLAAAAHLTCVATAFATADLMVQVSESDLIPGVTVTLVSPDGQRQIAATNGHPPSHGSLVITPSGPAGEYDVTIVMADFREERRVSLPESGLVTLTLDRTASDRVKVAYSGVFGGEEIIVTARKREERLQSTPLSIAAFTEKAIEERAMRDLSDVSGYTPNVDISLTSGTFGASSDATVYIRGIGQIDTAIFADPGVGIYVDGVYLARSQGAVLDLLDIERLEVLRGPQGTLFGKNTVGGAISLITRKPTGDFASTIDLTAGEFDRRDVKARVNGALNDKLFGSLALASFNQDGVTDSLASGEEYFSDNRDSLRGALRWLPSNRVVVDLTADVLRERERAVDSILVDVPGSPTLDFYNQARAAAGLPTINAGFIPDDLLRSFSTDPNNYEGDVWGTSLTVTWDLEPLSLTSISAYRNIDYFVEADLDGTPAPFVLRPARQQQDQLSQEFQLSGQARSGRLDWLVGSLYFTESAKETSDTVAFGGLFDALEAAPGAIFAPPGAPSFLCDPGPPLDGVPCFGGAGNPNNLFFFTGEDGFFTLIDLETTSYALFGEASYALSDRLDLTAGLRYTHEEKDFDFLRIMPLGDVLDLSNSDSWDNLSPRLSLAFQKTRNLLLYASISRGFKSGGFNGRPQDRGELVAFDPEKVWAYEAGFKSTLLAGQVQLNGAAFFNDYTDLQLSASIEVDGAPVFVLQNAGEAEIQGFELELVAEPLKDLFLTAGIGHADAQYTELRDVGVDGPDLGGAIPKTPEWDYNLSLQYAFDAGPGRWTVRGDYDYKSKIFNDISNTPEVARRAVGLVNARLAFAPGSSFWEIYATGSNLTDERYLEHGFFFGGFGLSTGYAGRPREWAVGSRLKF